MEVSPVVPGLVAGVLFFALLCPFALWVALPSYSGGGRLAWLLAEAHRRRALACVALAAALAAVLAVAFALGVRFELINKIG